MKEKVLLLMEEVKAFTATSLEEAEQFRLKFLSKKGILTTLFAEFRNTLPEDRKEIGSLMNQLKTGVQQKFDEFKASFAEKETKETSKHDLSLPADFIELGTRHPVSLVRNEMINIFARQGFTISEGPEIEDDWHNFTALNFSEDHPARDMQDTFFIERNPDVVLRTHTSSVQVRIMEGTQPPIKTISIGRVFRNEAISARAHVIFHQIEGLYINKDVSFADLKQTLIYFTKELFGKNIKIRLRPSYFPFTEPSGEMDITCLICKGKGCSICKNTGWVEILGCGMVDPNVLENCGIDSEVYSGYAFGIGIERTTLLKYQINDLRLFFENDLRFLRQFQGVI